MHDIYVYNMYIICIILYIYIFHIYIYIYKLYNYMKLPNKNFFKEQKKSQLKYYQMVLYTIQNLLPVKDILKSLKIFRKTI